MTTPFGGVFVVFETDKYGSGNADRLRHAMIPGPQRSAPADAANTPEARPTGDVDMNNGTQGALGDRFRSTYEPIAPPFAGTTHALLPTHETELAE